MNEQELTEFKDWLNHSINMEHLMSIYNADDYEFSLAKPRELCARLGHPELAVPTIHVTGSKGKGSVSRMIASVLQTANAPKQVGVFASPHISDFRERISGADRFFSDDVYGAAIHDFLVGLDRKKYGDTSWFELLVPFAALCFKNADVSHAVYEVGMGGRLDATNIIKPEICCITTIELEHTKWLGDTLEKIAAEKAGIIKEKTPVVVAAQNSESVREVFRKVAAEKHAPIYFVDECTSVSKVAYKNGKMHVKIESEFFSRPIETDLKMLGAVQAKNAAEAALALKIMNPDLGEGIIETGLANAKLPGRFEIREFDNETDMSETASTDKNINKNIALPKTIILDGAHTLESVRQTLETFDALYSGQKTNLLFSLVYGKDFEKIIPLLKNRFNKIFLTRPGDFKGSDLPALEAEFKKNSIEFISDPDFNKLIPKALKTTKNDDAILLATGSFYLLGEVIKNLKYNDSKHPLANLAD